MTTTNSDEAARTTIAEAVLGVSGVAFLRPALGDLLRSAVVARTGLRTPGTAVRRNAGVRITHPDGEPVKVEVHVVLLHGHRAVDVTRDIREAVRAAYPTGTPAIPVHVTVTGIL
ncbi:Asp23/Gls24 family envelope stress response protein [Streptomyces sp. NPDC057939]|uniref:Asp23/Gls24 family envelope stress response protein n=1 Tax=Streptomyces sp. NPDC057939 TaxID=3346284 RepID=UPI0036EFEEE4